MKPKNGKGSNTLSKLIGALSQYSSDLLGLLLVTLFGLLLLGLLRLTSGSVIDGMAEIIRQGFGWLAYLIPVLIGYIGVMVLTRRLRQLPHAVSYAQILYFEGAVFSLGAFLAVWGGQSVDRAINGFDGGVVGWGIARMLTSLIPLPFSSILLVLLFLFFLLAALNLWPGIIAWIDLKTGLYTRIQSQRKVAQSHLEKERNGAGYYPGKYPALEISQNHTAGMPPLSILMEGQTFASDETFIRQKALEIEKTLQEFGFPSKVAGYRVGPTIIQYALEPGYILREDEFGRPQKKKVRVAQIAALQRDLALALSAERLRIEAPIPGHAFIGIEIPNPIESVVRLRQVIESPEFQQINSPLAFVLGLDVSGIAVAADLKRMPHLLIAGTTGSGKSVCVTSIITCLMMNNSPHDLRIAIMDPKMVELARFNGLPHLLGKVETDPRRMIALLVWAIKEMEDRYKKLEIVNARDLDAYNEKMLRRNHATLPRIVIFIDELADLMATNPEQTEDSLIRLAQMARATGIHLVVATQRPSTDILTGLIKANFPARISFMVATSIDSRVILDTTGAETLMSAGDLLFLDPDDVHLQRAQGVFVDDQEIDRLVSYWLDAYPLVEDERAAPWEDLVAEVMDDSDDLLNQAVALIQKEGRASASLLQRRLRIGYPRAARLMDELERKGYVGPPERGGRERAVFSDGRDSES